MIVSVHLADLGVRRSVAFLRPGAPAIEAPGLRYAETAGTVGLAGKAPPLPPRGVAMIASWDDDAALDAFLASHPVAEKLSGGWHVRLEPNGPGAPVLVSGSMPRILARPDLDDALGDARFVGSRGLGRGTAQHPAIGEIERAAVQWALHRPERSAELHPS